MNRDAISIPDVSLGGLSVDLSGAGWRAGVGAVMSLVGVVTLVLVGYFAASVLLPDVVAAFTSRYVVGGVIALYWIANLSRVVDRYVDDKVAKRRDG